MSRVFDRQTRQEIEVPASKVAELVQSDPERYVFSGEQSFQETATGYGHRVQLSPEEASQALQGNQFVPEAAAHSFDAARDAELEAQYGDGFGNTAAAVGLGALRGATLGASDAVLNALLDQDDQFALQQNQIRNQVASTVGEVGSQVALAILSGGAGGGRLAALAAKTPAGAASRAATILSERALGTGGGILRSALRTGVAGGVEGAFFGAGQQLSQIALHDDPMTVESLGSTVGLGAALGFGAGAVFGGVHAAGNKLGHLGDTSAAMGAELREVDSAALRMLDETPIEKLAMSKATTNMEEAATKAEQKAMRQEGQVFGEGSPGYADEYGIPQEQWAGLPESTRVRAGASPGQSPNYPRNMGSSPLGIDVNWEANLQGGAKADLQATAAGGSGDEVADFMARAMQPVTAPGQAAEGKLARSRKAVADWQESIKGKIEPQSSYEGRLRDIRNGDARASFEEGNKISRLIEEERAAMSGRGGDTVNIREKPRDIGLDETVAKGTPGGEFESAGYEMGQGLKSMDDIKAAMKEIQAEFKLKSKAMGNALADPEAVQKAILDDAMKSAPAKAAQKELQGLIADFKTARQHVVGHLGNEMDFGRVLNKGDDAARAAAEALNKYHAAGTALDDAMGGKLGLRQTLDTMDFGALTQEPGLAGKLNALDLVEVADMLDIADVDSISPTAGKLLKLYAATRLLRAGRGGGGVIAKKTSQLTQRIAQGAGQALVAPVGRGTGWVPRMGRNVARQVVGYGARALANIPLALGSVQQRIGTGVKRAVEALAKPGGRAALAATSVSVFNKVKFGDSREKDAVHARADELRQAMANPAATKARIRESLAPVAAHNPAAAEKVQALLEARLQHLFDRMPMLGENPALSMLQGRPPVNPQDADKWGRIIKAAEDPLSLLDDLKNRNLSTDTVQTVKALYPTLFAEMQTQMLAQIAGLQGLPYESRLEISVMFDVPVDRSQQPVVIAGLQQMYAAKKAAQQQPTAPRGSVGTPQTVDGSLTPSQRLIR